jgi:hypothetical protein
MFSFLFNYRKRGCTSRPKEPPQLGLLDLPKELLAVVAAQLPDDDELAARRPSWAFLDGELTVPNRGCREVVGGMREP